MTKDDERIEVLPPPAEEEPRRDLVRKETSDPSPITKREPASFPWVNRFNRKRIETFTEVIKAETGLMHAVGDHAKTKERIRDIDIELETERLQRRNDLADQRRKALLAGNTFALEKKDIALKLARIDAELAELNKPPKQPKTKAEEHTEKLKEQAERQKYDIEREVLEKKKTIVTWQRIDEEKEQAKKNALHVLLKKFNVSSVENLPPEGLRELAKQYESIEDLFENMKAEG